VGQPKQGVRGRVADDEQSMTSNNMGASNFRHFDSFGGF
jgi:histone deacetylase complex regulatory component SIN3